MEYPIQVVRWALLAVALLLPVQGWADPVPDQRGIGTAIVSGTTLTKSLTVNAVSPLIAACSGNVAAVSATWNGSATEVIQTAIQDSTGTVKTTVFGVKAPATGTHDFVATFASAVSAANCAIIGTTGGDTVTGWRTVYTRTDTNGTGPGMQVDDSQAGDLVFHAVGLSGTTITFDAGEDSTSTEDDAIAGGSRSMGLSTKAATGANTVVGATDVSFYAEAAFAVMPAGGGSQPPRSLMMLGSGQ